MPQWLPGGLLTPGEDDEDYLAALYTGGRRALTAPFTSDLGQMGGNVLQGLLGPSVEQDRRQSAQVPQPLFEGGPTAEQHARQQQGAMQDWSSEAADKRWEELSGPMYQPKGFKGQVVTAAPEMVSGGAGRLATKALEAGAGALGSESLGQMAEGTWAEPYAKFAGALAGAPLVPMAGKAAKKGKVKKLPTAAAAPPVHSEQLFDTSDLESVPKVEQRDLPRYEPPRGVPQRILDLTSNPKVREQMLAVIHGGVKKGGKRWYNAEPLRHEFVAELGKAEGNKAFRRFMEYVSATSPRSKVSENVRNASYYYTRERSGKPLPQVGDVNPAPYGHMAQRLHQMNAQRVQSGGIDPLNNPKPPSFSENLSGNQLPATVDAHAFKLPAMLSQDPRFLQTAFKAEKGAPTQNIRGNVEKGLLNIEDVPPSQWEAQPKETEYLAMENYYKGLADELGITPAQAQSSAWQAGGETTGLGSSATEAFIETLQDRVMRTAKAYNLEPREVLRKMIRGDMSLLGIAGLGGLLGMEGYQDGEPGGT